MSQTDTDPQALYLVGLYNGHQAIAERVDAAQLAASHIPTGLDTAIIRWLNEGRDVVLTGNPGDGKTHLLSYLSLPTNTVVEKDASQETAAHLLERWRQARAQDQRFILAINHAPLRKLAAEAEQDPALRDIYSLVHTIPGQPSAIDTVVVYSQDQIDAESSVGKPQVMLVDLSQREILSDAVITPLLINLCTIFQSVPCPAAEGCTQCPLHDNATVLKDRTVQENLVFLLKLVSRRGFHATMRDLLGLLAYLITAGLTCHQLWRRDPGDESPSIEGYRYYNRLFEGRSRLFDAIRKTFDPGIYADPRTDLQLWEGHLAAGWAPLSNNIPLPQPATLDALKKLKRRYFFEHTEPAAHKFARMMTGVGRAFDRLLTEESSEDTVSDLIEMINAFYTTAGHQGNYRDRLYLWNQHRYSVGQPPGYVAMRSVSVTALRIYHPTLNPRYDQAFEVRQDHVLLAVDGWEPGAPALTVDWEMYKALWDAKQGKTTDVQPYSVVRRLDLFLRRLGRKAGTWSAVETIRWGDHKHRTIVSMRVNRKQASYEE